MFTTKQWVSLPPVVAKGLLLCFKGNWHLTPELIYFQVKYTKEYCINKSSQQEPIVTIKMVDACLEVVVKE